MKIEGTKESNGEGKEWEKEEKGKKKAGEKKSERVAFQIFSLIQTLGYTQVGIVADRPARRSASFAYSHSLPFVILPLFTFSPYSPLSFSFPTSCVRASHLLSIHSYSFFSISFHRSPLLLSSFPSLLFSPLLPVPSVLAIRSYTDPPIQWRRQGGEGRKLPPMGGRPKIMYYVCAFIVMELRITRQIHRKAIEQRAPLIHRQYNRDWGTSYSRPPIDPYLTSPLLQNPGGATVIHFLQWSVEAVDGFMVCGRFSRDDRQRLDNSSYCSVP